MSYTQLALLGVVVVVGLPLLVPVLGMGDYEYGVLAGLTVYAVPQVLAAAFPVSALSGEVGTLVKLVRVLLLGPVVLVLTLLHREKVSGGARLPLGKMLPWFIVGFLVFAALRSTGVLPATLAVPMREASSALTLAAMAGLGLGVDVRTLRAVGRPVVLTVAASLAVLITASLGLIHFLAIGA